ncbi:MAG: hypothetical protein H7A18_04005 [Sinobacteraceae bacterium]|nr:hypothetical protein [Nevskiaceae bacterium]
MAYSLVHWAHVLVMGYWLGSELVINALTHYVTRADSLPGAERMKLWDFVLDVDQHVRNAMIMSVPLGLSLAAWMGLSPLTGGWLVLVWVLSIAWFWLMWATHLQRKSPTGRRLAAWDWGVRYVLIAAFGLSGLVSLATGWPFPSKWLALKVLLVAPAIACGLGVRHYIRLAYQQALPAIAADRAGPGENALFRSAMIRATWVLVILWTILFTIGALGALKPF